MWIHGLRYYKFAPHHVSAFTGRICQPSFAFALAPVSPFPAPVILLRPHISDAMRYRNLNLLSIGYASRPRLRPRLTQGRSALPWNPWIFGLKDSHLHLATHSGILSSWHSTAPCRYRFAAPSMLLYQSCLCMSPRFRCRVLAPDIFGAGPLDQ